LLLDLLAACPRIGLLVTSRIALRIRAEHRFLVPPLGTPADDACSPEEVGGAPAVALFVRRARAMAPDFVLDADTAAAVSAICRRLDGIPLAIELAAARASLLHPEALLRRLEHRLSLLTGGLVDLPPRQQTLRDTLVWSHDLLGAGEQLLFRRLAVFAGGWSLEAAESVCADADLPAEEILDRLQVLVDNSLVRREGGAAGAERFGMLETIREYALHRLNDAGEAEFVRRRHATVYAHFAEQAEANLRGPEQAVWLRRLDREYDNLRAALDWATSPGGDGCLAVRFAAALGWYWYMHARHVEGFCWAEPALRVGANAPPTTRSRALTGASWLALVLTDHDRGVPWAQQAALLAGEGDDPQVLSAALAPLAMHRLWRNDRQGARRALDQGLRFARAAADRWQMAFHLELRSTLEIDSRAARRYCAEALPLARTTGDPWLLEYVLTWLGELDFVDGDLAGAESRLQEALRLARQHGYPTEIAYALADLAAVARERGDLASATRLLAESLMLRRNAANPYRLGLALLGAGALARASTQPLRAAHLLGAAGHLLPGGAPIEYHRVARADWDRTMKAARRALGAASFQTAWQSGQMLTLDEALADASRLLTELGPPPITAQ
jgi:predicted ATPase